MTLDNGIAINKGIRMMNNRNRRSSGSLPGLIMGGLLFVGLLTAPSASAEFNRVFFSINGDTTLSTMTQGDEFYWGSNCDSGATINWEVWYDANTNGVADPGTDALLTSENITDGNAVTEVDPILDGYSLAEAFNLFGEPGDYIFIATDIAADSSIQKVATMVAMSSPPNQLTGRILLPGISAPNSLLANKVVFAESESGGEGAFLAVTDNNGMYSMNVGAGGTGVEFFLWPPNVSGFVAPYEISAVASGVVPDNDFTYSVATDSVWGFVEDELGAVISFETNVAAESDFSWRSATTSGGRYAIYFSDTDNGNWGIGIDSRVSPLYLTPDPSFFDLDMVGSFEHDVTLISTDTVIYARIIESGGPPSTNYRIDAYSYSLAAASEAVSGTGTDSIATLPVSSLDPTDWQVWINQWDDDYPIPFGLTVSGGAVNIAPGDTVTLELVSGKLISGMLTQDPEDAPIVWDEVYVGAGGYGASPDGGGGYSFYASTGAYVLSVYADGYLTDPESYSFVLTDDITSGLDFVINEAHCRVSGTLVNVSLPLNNSYYAVVARTGTDNLDGYYVNGFVDSATGAYSMDLCDGDWTIEAPMVSFDLTPPAPTVLSIGEAPDVSRTLDLVYVGGCCTGRVGDANGQGGDEPTIGDVAVLIDAKFISVSCVGLIDCLTEGDANQSGGLNPTCDDITISDIALLIDYLFITGSSLGLADCL